MNQSKHSLALLILISTSMATHAHAMGKQAPRAAVVGTPYDVAVTSLTSNGFPRLTTEGLGRQHFAGISITLANYSPAPVAFAYSYVILDSKGQIASSGTRGQVQLESGEIYQTPLEYAMTMNRLPLASGTYTVLACTKDLYIQGVITQTEAALVVGRAWVVPVQDSI
jgi:hypothetical protein